MTGESAALPDRRDRDTYWTVAGTRGVIGCAAGAGHADRSVDDR